MFHVPEVLLGFHNSSMLDFAYCRLYDLGPMLR